MYRLNQAAVIKQQKEDYIFHYKFHYKRLRPVDQIYNIRTLKFTVTFSVYSITSIVELQVYTFS